MNVVRVKIKGEYKRFPLLTSTDFRDLLFISSDMENKTNEECQQILDEVLDMLYPGYSRLEQEHIFTKVYCMSFGKNVIKVSFDGGSGVTFMVIHDMELSNEYKIGDITIGFKYPKNRMTEDVSQFIGCIDYIIQGDEKYEWCALSEETRNDILDIIEVKDIENIVNMLTHSCDVSIKKHKINTLLPLFKILFSKAELTTFYKTNYIMAKHSINIDTLMKSTPMERTIYIALLADELKKAKKK